MHKYVNEKRYYYSLTRMTHVRKAKANRVNIHTQLPQIHADTHTQTNTCFMYKHKVDVYEKLKNKSIRELGQHYKLHF